MKRTLASALVLSLCLLLPGGQAPAQKNNNLQRLMAEKLNSSKLVLEGIALADYQKITRNAEHLIQISKTAEWFVYKTPRYEVHSNEFRRAADTIIQKAAAKSLDGVTLAYFELTMSCVRCHEYVREVRDARLPAPFLPFGENAVARRD